MIDNLKGTKEIAQETPEQWSQAIAKAKPRFRKGSQRVEVWRCSEGFGRSLERFGRGRERNGLDIREEIAQIREKAYGRRKKEKK